jgi:uncharacterized protein (TIGR03435 family)
MRCFVGLALFLTGTAYGQPVAPPRFEVASIRPSDADPGSSGINTEYGRLTASHVTLKRCIVGAYGVGPSQIFGGPPWLDLDRFNIAAKAEEPINDDDVLMAMLQTLLAERFHLVIHREKRDVRAYTLEVAKSGPRLAKAEGGNSVTSTGRGVIDAKNTPMDYLAKLLSRQMDFPVVDRTALEGTFNFKLQWTPENVYLGHPAEAAAAEFPDIFTALQEQLGLRLRSTRLALDALVIDHAEKPTEN